MNGRSSLSCLCARNSQSMCQQDRKEKVPWLAAAIKIEVNDIYIELVLRHSRHSSLKMSHEEKASHN